MRPTRRREASVVSVIALVVLAVPAWLASAGEPLEGRDPAKEAKKWKAAAEKAPGDADNWYNLGLAYTMLQQWKDAEPALRKAVELNPQGAAAHAMLGSALSHLGKGPEAINELETALSLDPSRTELQGNLGEAYFDAGQYDKAIETYKAALKAKPANPGPYYSQIGYAFVKKGETTEAIKWFERSTEAAPNDPNTFYNLGQIYHKLAGDGAAEFWAKAAEAFVKAAQLDAKDARAQFFAGEALIMAGKNSDGLSYLEKYLAADPDGKKGGLDMHQAALDYRSELKKQK